MDPGFRRGDEYSIEIERIISGQPLRMRTPWLGFHPGVRRGAAAGGVSKDAVKLTHYRTGGRRSSRLNRAT